MRCKLLVYEERDLTYRHGLELMGERTFCMKCEESSAKESRHLTERSEDLTTTEKAFEGWHPIE